MVNEANHVIKCHKDEIVSDIMIDWSGERLQLVDYPWQRNKTYQLDVACIFYLAEWLSICNVAFLPCPLFYAFQLLFQAEPNNMLAKSMLNIIIIMGK